MTEPTHTLGDKLADGTIYLGCINGVHSSMLGAIPGKHTWDEAMEKYTLPNRHEGLMIWELKQLKPDLFDGNDKIWLSETYKSYAYYQWLDGGHQRDYGRSYELVVRPVRRFKSFSDLIIPAHQAALWDITELENKTGLNLAGLRRFFENGESK